MDPLLQSDHGAGVPVVPVMPPQVVTVHGRRVLLVMPWQKQVSPITHFCVSALMDNRRTASALHFGDAFVAHSRNSCADAFLASECEYMLTVDDDMVIPFGNATWYRAYTKFEFPEQFMALNALDRLMSHKKTLVGALYFGRHPKGPPMYAEGANPVEAAFARRGPVDLAKPTRWVATGCMLVHRRVFEDVEKRFPRLARKGTKGGQWFTSTEAGLLDGLQKLRDRLQGATMDGGLAYSALSEIESLLASAQRDNALGSGEDVSFCLRAAAAGHQPHVDMGLICGHIGTCIYGPNNTST